MFFGSVFKGLRVLSGCSCADCGFFSGWFVDFVVVGLWIL